MGQLASHHPVLDDVEDFLAWLKGQEARYEFVDGRLIAMAGGSEVHNDIQVNILGELRQRLRGGRCKANGPDLLLRTDTAGRRGRFPDVSVTCGRENGRFITSPVVLFEILSLETELVDRTEKRREYQAIPSLRHDVLVSQDAFRVEVYSRDGDGWRFTETEGLEGCLSLASPGLDLPLAEIYAGLEDVIGQPLSDTEADLAE